MTDISATIDALTDQQAIRVLALTLDHDAPLPDPATLRDLDAGLRQALTAGTDLADYAEPGCQQASPGDLARATLRYLAAQPALIPVITQATTMADDTTRDPTLLVGALVVLALQTEIKLTRNEQGKWALTIHKRAAKGSTLGQVIGKLLAAYWPGVH
jgi:hypothetical protein